MTKWLLKAILQYWVITTSTAAISLHKGQGGYLCNDGGPSRLYRSLNPDWPLNPTNCRLYNIWTLGFQVVDWLVRLMHRCGRENEFGSFKLYLQIPILRKHGKYLFRHLRDEYHLQNNSAICTRFGGTPFLQVGMSVVCLLAKRFGKVGCWIVFAEIPFFLLLQSSSWNILKNTQIILCKLGITGYISSNRLRAEPIFVG